MSERPTRVVFVGGLKPSTTEEMLTEVFTKVGEVENVMVQRDAEGRSRRFALVTFKTPEMAIKAVADLDDTVQCQTCIHVELRKRNRGKFDDITDMHEPEGTLASDINSKNLDSISEQNSDSSYSESSGKHKSKHHRSHHKHRRHHHRDRRSDEGEGKGTDIITDTATSTGMEELKVTLNLNNTNILN